MTVWREGPIRQRWYDARGRAFGRRTFETDAADIMAEAARQLKFREPWPGDEEKPFGLTLNRVHPIEYPELGQHTLVAEYDVERQADAYGGRLGYLYGTWLDVGEAMAVDVEGKTIGIPFKSGGEIYRWKQILGPALHVGCVFVYYVRLLVRLADADVAGLPSFRPPTLIAGPSVLNVLSRTIGRVNSNQCQKVNHAPAGALLMLRPDTQEEPYGRVIVTVRMAHAGYDGSNKQTSWRTNVVVRKQKLDNLKSVGVWIDDETQETRTVRLQADFSAVMKWIHS